MGKNYSVDSVLKTSSRFYKAAQENFDDKKTKETPSDIFQKINKCSDTNPLFRDFKRMCAEGLEEIAKSFVILNPEKDKREIKIIHIMNKTIRSMADKPGLLAKLREMDRSGILEQIHEAADHYRSDDDLVMKIRETVRNIGLFAAQAKEKLTSAQLDVIMSQKKQ